MPTEMIQESALIEAVMMTRTQIDFLWQVFITVHIAVFALLFIYGEQSTTSASPSGCSRLPA
jgi:hypothetical protein